LSCDLVIARWRDEVTADSRLQACFLPDPARHVQPGGGLNLTAVARGIGEGTYAVTVQSDAFVRGVCLHADGYRCDDAHFWLAPGEARTVVLRAVVAARPLFGVVSALNLTAPIAIKIDA
jgi:hypothetical protein